METFQNALDRVNVILQPRTGIKKQGFDPYLWEISLDTAGGAAFLSLLSILST